MSEQEPTTDDTRASQIANASALGWKAEAAAAQLDAEEQWQRVKQLQADVDRLLERIDAEANRNALHRGEMLRLRERNTQLVAALREVAEDMDRPAGFWTDETEALLAELFPDRTLVEQG
jgi:hypothetical protein